MNMGLHLNKNKITYKVVWSKTVEGFIKAINYCFLMDFIKLDSLFSIIISFFW